MKEFKPKAIFFDTRDFNNDQRVYNLDNVTRTRIKDYFEKTTGKPLTDTKTSVTKQLNEWLESNITDNFMNLSLESYKKIKGISFEHITTAEEGLNWDAPILDSYTCWTNSDKGNEKLDDFNLLKKQFKVFANKYGINPNNLQASLRNVCFYDASTNEVYANQIFING